MISTLKIIYLIACIFLTIFMLGIAMRYSFLITPFNQSTLPFLPYTAIVAFVLTAFLVTTVAVGIGMYYLYHIIFRGR